MKFSITVREILPAVNLAKLTTNASSTIPLLACVLIQATADSIQIVATDYESRIQIDLPATPDQIGAAAIPAAQLSESLSVFDSDDLITFDHSGSRVTIQAGSTRMNLLAMPAEDFPRSVPLAEKTNTISFDLPEFQSGIESVLPFAPQKEPRKQLVSVFMETGMEHIGFVATDGKVLARRIIPATADPGSQITIPLLVCQTIAKITADSSNPRAELEFTDRRAQFRHANIEFTFQAVEGKYPAWERVVPATFSKDIRFANSAMTKATRQAAIMTERETPIVALEFEPGRVTVTASNHDKGESTATAPTEYADHFQVAFNSKFFLSALKVFPASAQLVMLANAPERQVIVFDAATGREPFFILIMPINVKKPEPAPEPIEPEDDQDGDEPEGTEDE